MGDLLPEESGMQGHGLRASAESSPADATLLGKVCSSSEKAAPRTQVCPLNFIKTQHFYFL